MRQRIEIKKRLHGELGAEESYTDWEEVICKAVLFSLRTENMTHTKGPRVCLCISPGAETWLIIFFFVVAIDAIFSIAKGRWSATRLWCEVPNFPINLAPVVDHESHPRRVISRNKTFFGFALVYYFAKTSADRAGKWGTEGFSVVLSEIPRKAAAGGLRWVWAIPKHATAHLLSFTGKGTK